MKSRKNLIIIPIIIIWFVFIVTSIYVISQPKPEIGDNMSSDNITSVIQLDIIEANGNNTYLYDKTRQNLFLYDEDGTILNTIDLIHAGSIQITEINEIQNYIWVYYVRYKEYVKISFSGEIIEKTTDDSSFPNRPLNYTKNYQNTSIRNNIINYSVIHNDILVVSKISLSPLIILGIFVFFGLGTYIQFGRKNHNKKSE